MNFETWITRPTIATLRDMLNKLEEAGWSPEQHIQVKQIINAPETFTVSPVEKWVGKAEALSALRGEA